MTGETKKQLQFFLGAVFFALLLIYAAAFFYGRIRVLGLGSDPGWSPAPAGNRIVVGALTGDDPPPIRVYDEVVAINGQQVYSINQFIDIFREIEPGSPYTMLTKRGNQFQQVTLVTRPIPISIWLVRSAASLIVPNIFLLTGLVVFLLKPYDKQAFLLALMFGMFIGAFAAFRPTFKDAQLWLAAVMFAVQVASLFLWPVFFHFFLLFPEPSPLLERMPRLEKYLYWPHLIVIFPYGLALNVIAAFAPEKLSAFQWRFSAIEAALVILGVLYITAGLLTLMVNYRHASRAARRKMRIVVAGNIAGFLPFFILLGLAFVFDLQNTNPGLSRSLGFISLFAFPLFPLSFAYAIIRHQVIPVRLIVRRGVRYLLVSRGFIIIQAIVVFAVLSFLLTGSRIAAVDRMGARADIVVTMAATALAIAVLTVVNQQVMPKIDRRFFREAYDAHQVLSDLGIQMRAVTTVAQLLNLAASKIQDVLHTENVSIFLRNPQGGDYLCVVSSRLATDGMTTSDVTSDISLPATGVVVEKLKQSSVPLVVDFQLSRSWLHSLPPALDEVHQSRQSERAVLRRIRSSLLLPVATKDELLGVMSLGAKLGDLPFSREDKQLLMAVAVQMALAIQNAQLVERATEEERLRHELEIATTVQRRLFPERAPELGHLELFGVCHPARGVGGDYYDFILLEQGKVGIAVADVSGKGISAALLMSTVQASLRSQAQSVNGNLTELVSSMNRLLHVSTDASTYATFFYAQFDQQTGTLTYVNAGHNPPMLMRGGAGLKAQSVGRSVARSHGMKPQEAAFESARAGVHLLSTGGPIIGAFQSCKYDQETIALDSGDLLVAYTDGVTEAFNADEEEFGEERLSLLITSSAHLPAEALAGKIVESVREWSGETPQHDDITLVVMKVK